MTRSRIAIAATAALAVIVTVGIVGSSRTTAQVGSQCPMPCGAICGLNQTNTPQRGKQYCSQCSNTGGNTSASAPASSPPVQISCPTGFVPFQQLTLGNSVCNNYPVESSPGSGCFRVGAACNSCTYCAYQSDKNGTLPPFNCNKEDYCGMSGDFCTDTDAPFNGGVNVNEKGTVNPGTGHAGERTDICTSDLTWDTSNGHFVVSIARIKEYACPMQVAPGTAGWADYINHVIKTYDTVCTWPSDRCIDGECVTAWEKPVGSCTSTDGDDITKPGQLTIDGFAAFKDSCGAGGPMVDEFDCPDGNTVVHNMVSCPEGTFCRMGEGSCSEGMPVSVRAAGVCGDHVCAYEEKDTCPNDCFENDFCGNDNCALWERHPTCQDCPAWTETPPLPRPGY